MTEFGSTNSDHPCIDELAQEFFCNICLEIFFEPSTTPCGHKECLESSIHKCRRRCPICRKSISNETSCNVNIVLWSTIQRLFPKEVEARKAIHALNSREEVEARKAIHALNNPRSLSAPPSSRDIDKTNLYVGFTISLLVVCLQLKVILSKK